MISSTQLSQAIHNAGFPLSMAFGTLIIIIFLLMECLKHGVDTTPSSSSSQSQTKRKHSYPSSTSRFVNTRSFPSVTKSVPSPSNQQIQPSLNQQSANHPHTAKHPRTKKANPVKSWLFLVLKFYFRGFASGLNNNTCSNHLIKV